MLRWLLLGLASLMLATFIFFHPELEAPLYQGTNGYPWWNNAVFYEVFVRSFCDSNGDGIGDLNGLTKKLDYLNDGEPASESDLGITGIWLMPIMPSPSYHGYDVTDYFDVNPEYGTLEDMKALVAEAHRRGIRVVIDLVLNHTSSEHPWFKEAVKDQNSKYRDYYLWSKSNPGYASPMGGQAWHPSPTGYYYAAFWGGMPDLNLENPDVKDEINKITAFWLNEVEVDGFRLDAIRHFVEEGAAQENTPSTHHWLKEFNQYYKTINPNALTIGEAWTSTREIVPYVGDEVDVAFEFETAGALLIAARDTNNGPLRVAHAVDQKSYPPQQFATFLTNHDQNRAMSELGGDFGKAKVAASLLLTGPGIPFIYYGEEIGMTGVKPDENIRLPMQWEAGDTVGFTSGSPWRKPPPAQAPFNVAFQTNATDSLLNHYRHLIRLRQRHPALRVGDWGKVSSSDRKVYAFLRRTQDETLLVVINLSNQPLQADFRITSGSVPQGNVTELFADTTVQPPELDENGRFNNYHPVEILGPYQTLLIRF